MPASSTSSGSSSSDEEDAALLAALASVATSHEELQKEHQKVAQQGQKKLGQGVAKASDAAGSAAGGAAEPATGGTAAAASKDSDGEDEDDDKAPKPLSLIERRIGAALDQRLERLLTPLFHTSSGTSGSQPSKKKRKQGSPPSQAPDGCPAAGQPGDSSMAEGAGRQGVSTGTATDLGCGVRLFRKVAEGTPVVLPQGAQVIEAGYVPSHPPPRCVELRDSLYKKQASRELALLQHCLAAGPAALPPVCQMSLPPPLLAAQAASRVAQLGGGGQVNSLQAGGGLETGPAPDVQSRGRGPTQGEGSSEVGGAEGLPMGPQLTITQPEDLQTAVKSAVKRLKKAAEQPDKVIKRGMAACAVDGEELLAAAATKGWQSAGQLESSMGILAHSIGQAWESGESASKQVRKRQRAKAHVRHVKHEAVVVEAKPYVPFEVRTARLLGAHMPIVPA